MGTWIQDYIKTYDDRPFIEFMCRRLAEIGCDNGGGGQSGYSGYSGQDGSGGTGGYTNMFLLMGG